MCIGKSYNTSTRLTGYNVGMSSLNKNMRIRHRLRHNEQSFISASGVEPS